MISVNQENIAKLLTLPEIFKGRIFSIPDYQRGYAWEEEQVKALHEDIEQLFDANHLHFTGTIVLTRNLQDQMNYQNVGDVYDIIDGQQRLTTVFIILCELIRMLEDSDKKETLKTLFIGRGEEGD